jgi:Fe-S cluster assembly ATP-binding protein
MKISQLEVTTQQKVILHNITLQFSKGDIHYILGPNGSGKSTLANVIMGHPAYEITKGDIIVDEQSIVALNPTKRAQAGIYLSMQYPPAIHGVSVLTLCKNMLKAQGQEKTLLTLRKEAIQALEKVGLPSNIIERAIGDGLSGGEKKRLEIAQISLLRPKYVILDEPDSGLDIDGTKQIATLLRDLQQEIDFTLIIITHYNQLLPYLPANNVTILKKGKVHQTGDHTLADKIMKYGFSYE